MLEHIYICRHGFRSNWVDSSITTSVTGMQRDPPLAAYGLEQASSLAHFLAHTQPPHLRPQLIFSSPFYRCIQTAEPTVNALNTHTHPNGPLKLRLEWGVQEWYSQVLPETGLHPRPAPAKDLAGFFGGEAGVVETEGWESTVYASRRGESLSQLQARCDLFADAFVRRVDEEYPEVKVVVVFAHAASVIALGRAFTGNKSLHISAGCASTSLYKRRRLSPSPFPIIPSPNPPTSDIDQTSLKPDDLKKVDVGILEARRGGETSVKDGEGEVVDGVAEEGKVREKVEADGGWECLWHGRANYLKNGVERDWGFHDVVLNDQGHVISDHGDHKSHSPSDELPLGLTPRFRKYLSKPDAYTPSVLRDSSDEVRALLERQGQGLNGEEEGAGEGLERAVVGVVDGEGEGRGALKRQASGTVVLESRM